MKIYKNAVIAGLITTIGVFTTLVTNEYIKFNRKEINFTVNNQELGCENINDIKDYLENNTNIYIGNIDITSCIDLVAYTNELENISFFEYLDLRGNNINIDIQVTDIQYDKLKGILENYNKEQTKSQDAYIINNDSTYEVVEDIQGTELDIHKIMEDLQSESIDVQNINLEEYLIEPVIKADDLKELVDDANGYINWTVSYNSGQQFSSSIEHVNIVGNTIEVKTEFITDIVKQLESIYDTAGKGFSITNNSGNEIEVLGGTYGNIMNSAEEKEYLIKLFENKQSENIRQPIMKQEMPEEIGDTYIEISIESQHLWFYKDGELISETDIVTGDAYKRRDTPTGVYFISERINGKYLTGDTYRTWVNKWMRLTNTGIGLHDASWRGRFGGSVYKGNGSHGCINLPKQYAYDLFEQVYTKMPVIIY